MKKYRHKPTGKIVEQEQTYWLKADEQCYYYRTVDLDNEYTPIYVVENGSDWEEIKPEPEVPPKRTICEELKKFCGINTDETPTGILEFRHPDCKDSFTKGYDPDSYKSWYWNCKSFPGTYISKIKVNDVVWEVGEVVGVRWSDRKVRITSFKWNDFHWMFGYDDSLYSMSISNAEKLPTNKPIVTLQGKDLYEGDTYYYMSSDFEYKECEIYPYRQKIYEEDKEKMFSTKELAEKYVTDNKPVYPAGLVEDLIGMAERNFHILAGKCQYNTAPIIDKLKSFKK